MASPASDDDRVLAAVRRAAILDLVTERGQARVAELAVEFGVSPDTIRRDLDHHARDGAIVRIHGGALRMSAGAPATVREQPVAGPDDDRRAARRAVATRAADLVEDGAAILLGSGPIALDLARALSDRRGLTIATNSLQVPTAIDPAAVATVSVFGGEVQLATQSTNGPVSFTVGASRREFEVRCDIAFVEAEGIDEAGYSSTSLSDAAMLADMSAHADRTVVLATSAALGRRLFARIAPLDHADDLVTDAAPPDALRAALTEAGVRLITPQPR